MGMKNIFLLIEKLFALLVIVPPIYMAYRFFRWYLKQQNTPEQADS